MDDAISAHAIGVGCSEEESRGWLRSLEALEGALARPAQWAYYQQADIAVQAAVLAHAIAETQAFAEGNKRAALAALGGFLNVNGYQLTATHEQLFEWMLALGEGLLPGDLGDLIRGHLVTTLEADE